MFLYSRERGEKKISNVSYHCVAEYLSSTKGDLDFNSLSGVVTDSPFLNICYWNQMIIYNGMRLSNAQPFVAKLFLNPSHGEETIFDVGVVSSQSSLGHWSHICKSCLMNNVYVKSVWLKTAWFSDPSVHQTLCTLGSSYHSPVWQETWKYIFCL